MIKIISCHIENFGNLSGEDFNFQDGINSFLKNNGWGKSTLASFIKAMFYGLPKVSQKEASPLAIIQERERFSPWNGKKFGGWLIFDLAGQQYKIVRYFAKTEKNDRFEILEIRGASETPTQRFTNNIGEELFSLDIDSFERSVFITLDPGKAPFRFFAKKESLSIKNKLLELVETVDDGCDYQLIQDNLNKALMSLKSSSQVNATGTIPSLTKSLEEDKEILRLKNEKKVTLKNLKITLEELENNKEILNRRIKELEKEKSNSDCYNKKAYYQERLEMLSKLRKEYNEKLVFFNGNTPDVDKLEVLRENSLELQKNEFAVKESTITENEIADFESEKNLFGADLLSSEELGKYILSLRKLNEIENGLAEKRFTSCDEEELNNLEREIPNESALICEFESIKQSVKDINILRHDIENNDNRIAEKEEELKDLQNIANGKKKVFKKWSYIISLISLLFSGGLIFALNNYYWILLLVSTLIILSLCYLIHFKHQKETSYINRELDNLRGKNLQLTNVLDEKAKGTRLFFSNFAFLSGLDEVSAIETLNNKLRDLMQLKQKRDVYNNELSKHKSDYAECKQKISNLINIFGKRVGSEDPTEILSVLKNVDTHISVLEPKINALKNAKEKIKTIREWLDNELSGYSFTENLSLPAKVDLVQKNARELQLSLEAIEAEEKQIAVLEKKEDFNLWKDAVKPVHSEDEINIGLKEARVKSEELNKEITLSSQQIEQLEIEVAQIPEYELRINQHSEELANASNKYNTLNIVKDFIEKAHKDLSDEFMSPMIERFSYYWKLFGDKKILRLNNEMDIYLDDSGETHGVAFFSSGYRDVMNFCARLAFIDVIFKDDSTLIILDDPFVNFDAEKIATYKSVLQNLSSKRQIFYFTCHESRMI